MNTLAHAWGDDGGPGPWILLFPLIWAAIVVGAIWLLRRTVWRGGRGPFGRGPGGGSPVALLGRRFAAGEIDEEEYRHRRAVLTEDGRRGGGGGRERAA
ncbi:SHOCT domain-containing protein [Streptomyces sp. 6N223]|uniref:SHOCT domain-containing protein n=1 Tax=Streptomyces sp. 6N223 TaxID=3457412 RepID=UPI003FCEFF8C